MMIHQCKPGQRGVENVHPGTGELPKQVSFDQGLGWPLHQGKGTYKQCYGYEIISILQGLF